MDANQNSSAAVDHSTETSLGHIAEKLAQENPQIEIAEFEHALEFTIRDVRSPEDRETLLVAVSALLWE